MLPNLSDPRRGDDDTVALSIRRTEQDRSLADTLGPFALAAIVAALVLALLVWAATMMAR